MEKLKSNGLLSVIIAYTIWGILPIYWKLVQHVPAIEILANRLVWSFLLMMIIVVISKQSKVLIDTTKDKKQLLLISIAGFLITMNWGIYIFAVNTNNIIEASLGYFLTPLLMVGLGVFFFKESLNRIQIMALVFAFIGVLIKTIQYGQFPFIALGLALSFSFYSTIKKSIHANAIIGLALETAIVTPIALIYLLWKMNDGVNAYQLESTSTFYLLIGSGIVTAVPLLFFGIGAKKVSMVLIGFAQYIGPTLSLILGVFLYHESFKWSDLFGFVFIWVAIILYSYTQLKQRKNKQLPIEPFQEEVLQEL